MLFLTCLSIYEQNSNRNFEDSKIFYQDTPLTVVAVLRKKSIMEILLN